MLVSPRTPSDSYQALQGRPSIPHTHGALEDRNPMLKTDADRPEAELFGTPESLRALAEKAKRFAETWPHDVVGQRIIERALKLEAEAAALEPVQANIADATSTSSSRRTGLAI
jgi:hypothetical protein